MNANSISVHNLRKRFPGFPAGRYFLSGPLRPDRRLYWGKRSRENYNDQAHSESAAA